MTEQHSLRVGVGRTDITLPLARPGTLRGSEFTTYRPSLFVTCLPVVNIDNVLIDKNLTLLKQLHGAVYPPVGR